MTDFTRLPWVLGAALVCAPAAAMTWIGPPAVRMQQGQWSLGGVCGYSEQDVEVADEGILEDMEIETRLARIAVCALTDRVELFGLLGAVSTNEDFLHGSPDAAFGGGIRATVTPGEPVAWGFVAQALYADLDESDFTDIQIGLGPCWREGPFLLYGGAMIHLLSGDWVDQYLDLDVDFRQDSAIGAYLGGGLDLWDRLTVTIEGQLTGGGSCGAVSVEWRF
jgi:hypothetical protein